MASEWDGARPDILTMGKAISGGMMPVSAVCCDDSLMDLIQPGDHGSTYGGNPLAMAVAHQAVKSLVEEGMIENSQAMGEILYGELMNIKSPLIKEVRGRGLFRSIEIVRDAKVDGTHFATELMKLGLLTKATHQYTLRLAPALVITKD